MRFRPAAPSQIKPGEQRGEPRLALHRFGEPPASRQKQGAEERRQGVGLRKTGAPGGEVLRLVQSFVIQKSVAVRRRGAPLKDRVGGAGRRREVRQRPCPKDRDPKGPGPTSQRDRGAATPGSKGARPGSSRSSPAPCPAWLSGDRGGRPSRRKIPAGVSKIFGIARCRLPAQAQVVLGPDEGVGRGADVHAGVVEDEVVQRHELALGPEGGAGLGAIGSGEDAGADGRGAQPLVEAGESVVGGGERPHQLRERCAAKREDAVGAAAAAIPPGGPGGACRISENNIESIIKLV